MSRPHTAENAILPVCVPQRGEYVQANEREKDI